MEKKFHFAVTLRIFLIPVLMTGSLFIFAQNPREPSAFRYGNQTEFAVSFGLGNIKTDVVNNIQLHAKNDEIIINLQTINGVRIQQKAFLGIGVGVEKWQYGWFYPVFAHLSYNLKPTDNTFYGALNIGSSIGTRDSTSFFHAGKGAFMISIGIGYKMKVAKKLQFLYEIFYKYQAIKSDYSIILIDSTNTRKTISNIDYTVPYNFVGFKIGISY